jgi:hypothetical protein
MSKEYGNFLKRTDLIRNQVERERIREQQAAKSRSKATQQQNAQRYADYQRVLRAELEARIFHNVLSIGGPVSSTSIDPDAQAFITAAAITDPTQQAAINTLVVDLKGYSIWTKMKALYPFVGGTASQHKFNLKDPRDLDAAFRLTFAVGVTHSSTGMVGNGSSGYADTFFTPSTSGMLLNSAHLGFYSRTNSNAYQVEMGNWNNTASTLILIRQAGNGTVRMNNGAFNINFANTNAQGFYLSNRTASNVIKAFKNGVVQVTSAQVSNSLPTTKITLLAFNDNGLVQYYSTKQCLSLIHISEPTRCV